MSLFSKLFGSRASTITTTVSRPLKIHDPTIGFLNLRGETGALLLEADKGALGSLFSRTKVSDALPPPQCDVLFIYCSLDPQADASVPIASPRDLIKSARASVAIFASENDSSLYIKRMGNRTDWAANIVMVINRNGDKFPAFFRQLFTAMFEGRTMPMAWVQVAPQGPAAKHSENPSSIFAAEAGHVTFIRSADHRGNGP